MEKISVYSAIKLWSIVNYNLLRYSESTNYILPHNLDIVFIFDGDEGFSFYPFTEIVGDNQQ